jgi:uncharacterized protein (UPF0332 family)
MTWAEVEYVRHRLDRATSAIKESRVLIETGFLTTAVNRLYYACFYAVSALLYSQGYSSSRHSGVIALFDQHFVKTGLLPRELGKFLHLMFDRRQEGDYKDMATFDPADVEVWFGETQHFVRRVSDWLSANVDGLSQGD